MLIMIYGADGLRVRERVVEMRQKFVDKFDPSGINLAEIAIRAACDVAFGEIAQQIASSPFLSPKRMVIIDGLLSQLKKSEVSSWRDLFMRTPESTIVILSETLASEKVHKLLAFAAFNECGAHVYSIDLLTGSNLRSWVLERAKLFNASFSLNVAEAIIARVGSDTRLLNNELNKLAAYARGEVISLEMVELLCGSNFQEDVFGLLDALSGDPNKALERLAKERSAGAEDFPLFGMIIRQIRLLLAYKLFIERTGSPNGVASALGLHPYVVQKLSKQSSQYSLDHLRVWHRHAVELDRAMKRGLSPSLAVDRLVIDAVMSEA